LTGGSGIVKLLLLFSTLRLRLVHWFLAKALASEAYAFCAYDVDALSLCFLAAIIDLLLSPYAAKLSILYACLPFSESLFS